MPAQGKQGAVPTVRGLGRSTFTPMRDVARDRKTLHNPVEFEGEVTAGGQLPQINMRRCP